MPPKSNPTIFSQMEFWDALSQDIEPQNPPPRWWTDLKAAYSAAPKSYTYRPQEGGAEETHWLYPVEIPIPLTRSLSFVWYTDCDQAAEHALYIRETGCEDVMLGHVDCHQMPWVFRAQELEPLARLAQTYQAENGPQEKGLSWAAVCLLLARYTAATSQDEVRRLAEQKFRAFEALGLATPGPVDITKAAANDLTRSLGSLVYECRQGEARFSLDAQPGLSWSQPNGNDWELHPHMAWEAISKNAGYDIPIPCHSYRQRSNFLHFPAAREKYAENSQGETAKYQFPFEQLQKILGAAGLI